MSTIILKNFNTNKFEKLEVKEFGIDFDATSFNPSAVWNDILVYPMQDNGFTFERHVKDVYVEVLNNQYFNQNGKKRAFLKRKFYDAPYLIFQRLPIKAKVKNIQFNQMRNS